MYQTDTIAAIATAMSDSGIGIVRLSGENAIDIADKIICSSSGKSIVKNAKSHTIKYGYLYDSPTPPSNDKLFQDRIVDEVLVSVFYAPKSYTGENTVEINCHGSVFVLKKTLEIAVKAGARIAQPGEFTKRAFLNGRIDLSEAEAVMDLIHSKNEMALKASVNQLRGDLANKVKDLRSKIIYEIAFIESALDDPEHISLDGYPQRLSKNLGAIKEELKKMIDSAQDGKILREGIVTVIVGKPNAGKSSLLNMILGKERAIVTDIAGTTRDILEEYVNLKGIHLNIIDTAGIRETTDTVEKIGVDRAKQYSKEADLILYVVDTSVELDENDKEIMKLISDKKTIFLLNKSDLDQKVKEKDIFEIMDEDQKNIAVIHTSARSLEGMEDLEKEIEKMFYHGDLKKNDEIIITNLRHKEELEKALDNIILVQKSIEDQMPEDFYSIDLMSAYSALGNIIGEEVGDDLVDEIFSKFCMGK